MDRPAILPSLASGLLAILLTGVASAEQQIDFEEALPVPTNVGKQYCSGAVPNQGVEILGTGIVYEPVNHATSSPTHALTTATGGEFAERTRILQIRFTTPQSFVKVKAGLDENHPFLVDGILRAYSGWPGASPLLGTATVNLSLGPNPIITELAYTHGSAAILSVEIEFKRSDGVPAIEVIDDLRFSSIGPTCVNDSTNPLVEITAPAPGQTFFSPTALLGFRVRDGVGGSGIASVEAEYRDAGNGLISGFPICGLPKSPSCLYTVPNTELEYAFLTELPQGTRSIVVRARDFSANLGAASVNAQLVPPGPDMNLWLQSLEITQAIQSWLPENHVRRSTGKPPTFSYPSLYSGDGVPLVADRATVVRVYAGVDGTAGGVPMVGSTARLRCGLERSFVLRCPGPLELVDTKGISIDPGHSLVDRRRDATRSWNFALPDAWVKQGTIHLEAEIDAALATPECAGCDDSANRLRVEDIHFWSSAHFQNDLMKLLTISLNVGPVGAAQFSTPALSEVRPFLEYIRKTYPVPESSVHTGPEGIYYNVETEKKCSSLLNKLKGALWDPGSRRSAQGVAKVTGYDCGGVAWLAPGKQGFSIAGSSRSTMAQETAHNLGLLHAGPPPGHGGECRVSEWCDTDWPWPHGTIGDYGFDVLDPALATVYVPGTSEADPHDFMSYGGNHWVSRRTWIRLFNEFSGNSLPYPTAAAATVAAASESLQRYFLVRGGLDEVAGWQFEPVFELEAPVGTSDGPGSGAYSLYLLDGSGVLLASRAFDLLISTDGDDGGPIPAFGELVPFTAGVQEIELWQGGSLLAQIQRSPNAPTVTLFSPTAAGFVGEPNEPHISWEGEDTDGDPLRYLVEYDPNGQGDWQTLAMDWEDTRLDVTAPELLEGGAAARVRVSASDGLNQTSVVSPAFDVPNRLPQVAIHTPVGFALALEGFPVVLRASAWDLEDGAITDPNHFEWWSLTDGLLGQGPRVDVSTLSPGLHLLGPLVTDSQGAIGGDATWVAVVPFPNRQPIADAGPDRRTGVGGVTRLDGAGSTDPDGDALAHHWAVASSPPGGSAWLSDPNAEQPDFTDPSLPGDYVVSLVVDDGTTSSLPDLVTVHVGAPANDDAGSAASVADGSIAGTLGGATNDGSASQGQPDQPDVWYVYTPVRDGILSVNTCGSNDLEGLDGGVDTVLSLHSAPAGPELAVNDDWPFGSDAAACVGLDAGLARDSAIRVSTGGETVWIRVSRYGPSARSEFVLSLQLTNPDDFDLDGLDDPIDSCPYTPNPLQEDSNGDAIGDACQCGDVSDDGELNVLDWVLHERYLVNLPPALPAPRKCSVVAGATGCDPANRDALRTALTGTPPAPAQSCAAANP